MPKQLPEEPSVVFMVSSGFGGNTNQPYVQILIEKADFITQMPPAKARELAMNLLESADAADSDAFLVSFLRKKIGANDNAIASILIDFREWREKQEKDRP